MQLAWLTDIHLNFLDEGAQRAFTREVALTAAEAVVITGDIAQAFGLVALLRWLGDRLTRPVYFVLGNHDYYQSSVAAVRERVAKLSREHDHLCWLPAAGPVRLTAATALVGHGGWADGRLGDHAGSKVGLNDYLLIAELAGRSRQGRLEAMQRLAAEAAESLRRQLAACDDPTIEQIVVATHVPPFREACWHEGRISGDDWLPHFSSQAAGEVLAAHARAHPSRRLLVLCGHTHGAGETRPLENLTVLTGGAAYGAPIVQRLITA